MITIKKLSLHILAMSFISAPYFAYADCNKAPTNPKGSVAKLKKALQQASNSGKPLRITGTYRIGADIRIHLRKDIKVNATGARFIATKSLDGDMFSIDASANESSKCGARKSKADVEWTGGFFNMIDAKVSQVVPKPKSTTGRVSSKLTADALSIRGVIQSENQNKLGKVVIEDIHVKATSGKYKSCYEGGGDSGILLTGGTSVLVKNNTFTGVRDAGIYLTSGGNKGQLGDNYTYRNNTSHSSCYGLTSKRGADNLVFSNNTIRNSIGAIGVTNNSTGRVATNVKVINNDITNTVRGISMYRAQDVLIKNNKITNLGHEIYGEKNASGFFGNVYQGVLIAGTIGSITVTKNKISGTKGKRRFQSRTMGVSINEWDKTRSATVEQFGNNFSRLDRNVANSQ